MDTDAFPGHVVSPHYDSLVAKVIVWAPDRELALNRMERALDEFDVAGPGVHTTIPFTRRILDDPRFRKGRYSTGLVDRLTRGPAAPAPGATNPPTTASHNRAGPTSPPDDRPTQPRSTR